MRALFLSLLALSASANAYALDFYGVDDSGRTCGVQLVNGKLQFQTGSAYSFSEIPFSQSSNALNFDSNTIDRGGSRYSPPMGEKVKFGNLGLIRISGFVRLDQNGDADSFEFRAVGGIGNWWRTTFRCFAPGPI